MALVHLIQWAGKWNKQICHCLYLEWNHPLLNLSDQSLRKGVKIVHTLISAFHNLWLFHGPEQLHHSLHWILTLTQSNFLYCCLKKFVLIKIWRYVEMTIEEVRLDKLGTFDAILMDPPWQTARSNSAFPTISVEELASDLIELHM